MREEVQSLKVAIVIPDRGDRSEFMANCSRLIARQTVMGKMKTEILIKIVDYPPVDDKVDITPRYRFGYDFCRGKGLDVICYMENDDWYSEDYLEYMLTQWVLHGRPPLFGTRYTIYYHIRLGRWYTYYHSDRASMMNTLMKPDMEVPWPPDQEPFTDAHLWFHIKGWVTFNPDRHYSLGIKHGVGKCGGPSHNDRFSRYQNEDEGLLQVTVDPESYEFYKHFLGT